MRFQYSAGLRDIENSVGIERNDGSRHRYMARRCASRRSLPSMCGNKYTLSHALRHFSSGLLRLVVRKLRSLDSRSLTSMFGWYCLTAKSVVWSLLIIFLLLVQVASGSLVLVHGIRILDFELIAVGCSGRSVLEGPACRRVYLFSSIEGFRF